MVKKRVGIIADAHCGHIAGLTPPPWQNKVAELGDDKGKKIFSMQRKCWEFYERTLRDIGVLDVLLVNGDMIDGTGYRSGGTEQLAADRLEQCDIAACCIRQAITKSRTKCFMTIGTAYHTGEAEDFESIVAGDVGAEKIGSHEWVDVNGVIFDVKHHIAGSQIPHGRHTAISRDRLWNQLWSARDQQPLADVIIRSHVHYYAFAGGGDWVAMTTPALQGFHTKFGARRCSGTIDFGLVVFDVSEKGQVIWRCYLMDSAVLSAKAIKA